MMPFGIDKKIRGIATDKTVSEYLKSNKVVGEKLYVCDNLSVYGTDYIRGQYVILPNSTNSSMMFGRIVKLLCDEEFAYIEYRKTSSCSSTEAPRLVDVEQVGTYSIKAHSRCYPSDDVEVRRRVATHDQDEELDG